MGRMDRHLRLEQRISEIVEQRGTVAGIGLDHGVAVGRAVIDQDVGRDVERLGPRARQRAGGKPLDQLGPVGECIGNRLFDPLELVYIVERAADRILHKEIVERHSVTRRVDARVDNAAPGEVDAARNAVEQAGMVGGVDGDECRAARRVHGGRNRQVGLARIVDVAGVAFQNVVGLRHPIGFGQTLGIGVELGGWPGERLGEQFLLQPDTVGTAALLVAQTQNLFGRFEQFRQQLTLPAVPDARPHCADINDGQHQQQAEPLWRLHDAGKVEHGLEVRQIALERGRRHQQMLANEPGNGFGFSRRQPEARTQFERDLRP